MNGKVSAPSPSGREVYLEHMVEKLQKENASLRARVTSVRDRDELFEKCSELENNITRLHRMLDVAVGSRILTAEQEIAFNINLARSKLAEFPVARVVNLSDLPRLMVFPAAASASQAGELSVSYYDCISRLWLVVARRVFSVAELSECCSHQDNWSISCDVAFPVVLGARLRITFTYQGDDFVSSEEFVIASCERATSVPVLLIRGPQGAPSGIVTVAYSGNAKESRFSLSDVKHASDTVTISGG